jgi:colicin import membrane protein
MHEFWARTKAFGLSIGVHVIAAYLIVLGTMDWRPFRPPDLRGLTIEAVIVDTAALRERREQARREAELAVQRQLEQARRERELVEQQERERREALERRRQEEERLQRQEQELERIRQQREEAERQRRLEEERLKQLEARRRQQAEAQRQAQAQAELQRQLDAEQAAFRAGELATLSDQYQLAIQAQVTRNWLRPPTARPGLRCTLRIIQIPGGEVISASIVGSCNGDEATRRSLIAAVERAGSLPYRGFEDVFEREIDFYFRYDGE